MLLSRAQVQSYRQCVDQGRAAEFNSAAIRIMLDTIDALREQIPERTPDGHPQVWLLYRPEPWAPESMYEQQRNGWLRRCDVFTSREAAVAHLEALQGQPATCRQWAPDFPDLWVCEARGHRWWLTPAPVDPPGGQR